MKEWMFLTLSDTKEAAPCYTMKGQILIPMTPSQLLRIYALLTVILRETIMAGQKGLRTDISRFDLNLFSERNSLY